MRIEPTSEKLEAVAEDLRSAGEEVGSLRAANESDLRHRLFLVLGSFALDVLGLSSADVRQEGTNLSGRYDSLIGRAVVEYKQPHLLESISERRRAAAQAIRYLESSDLGAHVVVITDGSTWGILRDPDAGPESGEQAWLDLGFDGAAVTPEQRFVWRANSVASCRRVLTLIATVRSAPVTATSVTDRLGPSRARVKSLIRALAAAIHSREEGSRTDLLFQQWIRVAGVAYGIDSADVRWPKSREKLLGTMANLLPNLSYPESVFVLHSYVGFSCKLLACELLALRSDKPDLRPTQWIALESDALILRLRELEDGHLTETLGAPGLLAGDLFGWYLAHLREDVELRSAVVGVMEALAELAWARVANAGGIAMDLLRDFYQVVVPRGLRKALGEFFTPRWLAERVLVKTIELWRDCEGARKPFDELRILDPTCGSGTFLVAALRMGLAKLISEQRDEDSEALSSLVDRTIGFDINPVSVLMSRVNMLLVLGERAQHLAYFAPRIYEADSILLPEIELGQFHLDGGGKSRRIMTAVGSFFVPEVLASLEGLKALRENIELGIERGRSSEVFASRLEIDLQSVDLSDEEIAEALDGAVSIYERVMDLAKDDKNGVWGRIIEQATAPLFLDQVDIVVGNPPWVSWKNLPSAWKEASEHLWKQWGLWQETSRGGGVPLSDISVLLAARALHSYASGGYVSLVFPLSVKIADPGGRKFRGCELEGQESTAEGQSTRLLFAPLFLDDFSSLHPFSPDAQNEPVAIYLKSGQAASFPFPGNTWQRSRARTSLDATGSWPEIRSLLSAEEVLEEPLHGHDPGSPWAPRAGDNPLPLIPPDLSHYQWGRGYETRGLDGYFYYEILSPKPLGTEELVRVRNLPNLGTNTAGERPREALVEPRYIWPLIKGEQVHEWICERRNIYCLVAHDTEATGEVVSVKRMMKECPRLYDFLEPWLSDFRGRSLYRSEMDGSRPWGLSGPINRLTPKTHAVLVRYIATGGKPQAAVIQPEEDQRLGRTTLPLPNNKSNIFFADDDDEAYYLAAWVNARKSQQAIGRFAASTGITPKALKNLPVPPFDTANDLHGRLVQLSRDAHVEASNALPGLSNICDEIDCLVMELGRKFAAAVN